MDCNTKLEFDIILDKIASSAPSEIVAAEIKRLLPATDAWLVNKLLTQTGDALAVLASHKPDLYFEDISEPVKKAGIGSVLSPAEFLRIKLSVAALRSLKSSVESMSDCDSLKDITAWVRPCEELEREIDRTIENESEIKDGASDKLFSLRRAIQRANAKLKERLDGYTRQSDISKYLRDNIVTVRGGRYVLPVRSDCRANVKGLVHDVSATGATVFVEPFAVVESNNEIITLKTEEQTEIERILLELGRKVAANADQLMRGQEVLVECGVIFAKAEYAKAINAYRPNVNVDGKINLIGARHPLIDAHSVVPVDISPGNKKVLLISGPNTGGKTVALKTVGLFSLLAACGIFIPANEGSSIAIFENVYCDIGDSQSITQSLSTFSAHIKNLAEITAKMDSRSLVLLDEVGDGTDPEEGAALAIAIIKKISASGATAVVTTHFDSVKRFALGNSDIANACMQFDSKELRPTYRLLNGVSGSSYALEIAERLGLDKEIIFDARNALSAEKVALDTVMREAEQLRNDIVYEKQQTEVLMRETEQNSVKAREIKLEYEKKLSEINENARAIIRRRADDYSEKAESIIEEIKSELKAADEAALFRARKAAKKLTENVPSETVETSISSEPALPEQLTLGTQVYITGFNKNGIIASGVRGNKVLVAIGSIKTELPVSALSLVTERKKSEGMHATRAVGEPVNKEIMLLGYTVDDATTEIDRVISDIPPHSTLRIVHGKGTGALGKGIQAYLKRNPKIKSFRYGRYGEGDTGVTIAELK